MSYFGMLHGIESKQECGASDWMCEDGLKCINKTSLCDATVHCEDKSDENVANCFWIITNLPDEGKFWSFQSNFGRHLLHLKRFACICLFGVFRLSWKCYKPGDWLRKNVLELEDTISPFKSSRATECQRRRHCSVGSFLCWVKTWTSSLQILGFNLRPFLVSLISAIWNIWYRLWWPYLLFHLY